MIATRNQPFLFRTYWKAWRSRLITILLMFCSAFLVDHGHKENIFYINWRLLHGLGLRKFSRRWCYIGLKWSRMTLSFGVAQDGDLAWVQQCLAPCVSASAHYRLRYPKMSQSCGIVYSQQVLPQSHQAAGDSFHRYFWCSCLSRGWSP